MFSRSKKQPPYVEGIQGRYVKRDSPPPVPSLTSHQLLKKTTAVDSNANPYPSVAVSSLSASSVSFSSTPSVPIVVPPSENNNVHNSIGSSFHDVYSSNGSQPLLHAAAATDPHPHRTTFEEERRLPNSNLSSHSFSDPRSRDMHKRMLTTSHSIGNVESYPDQYERTDVDYFSTPYRNVASLHSRSPRHVSSSLQTLPGRSFGSSIIGDDCLVSRTPQEDLPLPDNWAVEVTSDGIRYYVDHTTRRTHWIHPYAQENLPPGWKKHFSPETGVLYYNSVDGRSQLEHPGLAPPISRTDSMLVASRRVESAVEHLNIIQQEEVPDWLMMYTQADSALDHLLEWDLFNPNQLKQYDEMLLKLYKQEVIDTVRHYERMRTVLNREIVRRTQPQPIHRNE